METSNEFKQKISQYLLKPRFIEVLNFLGVEPNIKEIEKYLETYPVKNLAERKFLRSIESYFDNNRLPRYVNGLVDSTNMLPIANKKHTSGMRSSGKYLGQDGKIYIKKQAEGIKGNIFGEEGKYNPTMAQAIFEFLGEKASKSIPAFEGFPYFYILSENFLENNQSVIQLSSLDFADFFGDTKSNETESHKMIDNSNSITHSQIISAMESFIRNRYEGKLTDDIINGYCQNIKRDYAIQETLKEFIYSADQNMGNTSLIITKAENGTEKIELSPAYDLDISFNIGYKLLHVHGNRNNNKFYRTAQNGEISLNAIVEEFSETIPGYLQKLGEILDKFNNDYLDQMIEKAFQNSGAVYFKNGNAKENYGLIIMRRVAELRQAYKDATQKYEKIKSDQQR